MTKKFIALTKLLQAGICFNYTWIKQNTFIAFIWNLPVRHLQNYCFDKQYLFSIAFVVFCRQKSAISFGEPLQELNKNKNSFFIRRGKSNHFSKYSQ